MNALPTLLGRSARALRGPLQAWRLRSYFSGRPPEDRVLFDADYYRRNNPDVSDDPLSHFVSRGASELRNPSALFDAKFYVTRHPEAASDPLRHYLQHGTQVGFDPNPYFDSGFYQWKHPDVNGNPLVHFLTVGAAANLDPHPLFAMKDYQTRYPDVAQSGGNALSHYLEFGQAEGRLPVRHLYYSEICQPAPAPMIVTPRQRRFSGVVPVFCVYGPGHVDFIHDALIPEFMNQWTDFPIELHFLNYKNNEALIQERAIRGPVIRILDHSAERPEGHLGFGDGVNTLFRLTNPEECFFLCNPDAFPMAGCLSQLMNTYRKEDCAIVEARQWPQAHPKEFDPKTLETPWASGAFDLISAESFRELRGFDPIYFLYMEDVDLSWRAWLSGRRVLHQPLARCAHATGLHSYRPTRYYQEHFFSLRNYLVIAYKFWHELGERVAVAHLESAQLPDELRKKILASYEGMRGSIETYPPSGRNAEKVKILGLNLFHDLQ